MRYILLCAILTLSFNAAASENTKREQVVELINLMNMSSMMEAMYAQMEGMMQNTSKELGVKPSEQPIFDKYYGKMTTVMKEEMSWKKMEPQIIDLYVRHFDEKEISDMLAFYETETGKSVIKKMPLLMQESMLIGQQMMKNVLPKLRKVSQELASELKDARESEEHEAEKDKKDNGRPAL